MVGNPSVSQRRVSRPPLGQDEASPSATVQPVLEERILAVDEERLAEFALQDEVDSRIAGLEKKIKEESQSVSHELKERLLELEAGFASTASAVSSSDKLRSELEEHVAELEMRMARILLVSGANVVPRTEG